MWARRNATFANVMSTTALFMVLGGTSYAAVQVQLTGANIKNETLTSQDIKNSSLQTSDLSTSAKSSLTGPQGLVGLQGPKGDPGAPAKIKASFAQESPGTDSSDQSNKDRYVSSPLGNNPNSGREAWYVYNNIAEAGDGDVADAIDGQISQPLVTGLTLSNQQSLLSLTDGTSPGGTMLVDYNSYVSGTASITLLHRGPVHTRAECQMFLTTNGGAPQAMGKPVWVSSNTNNQLITASVVGTITGTASVSAQKIYNVLVKCRNGDVTGDDADEWEYVRGNLTATAVSRI